MTCRCVTVDLSCDVTYACIDFAVSFAVVRDLFFFFKQKTAYEMRISDWSSDVCSSDLDWNRSMLLDVRVEVRDDRPRLIRRLDELEQIEVARAHHALLDQRLEIDDALPELLAE